MPFRLNAVVACLIVALAVPVVVAGQSLDEIARQEAARRKATEAAKGAPKKVFTNSDLKAPVPPATTGEAGQAAASGEKADTAKADATKSDTGDAAKGGEPGAKPDETQTPEYWQAKMTAAREDLRRNESFAEALQSRINALTADFAARDDPYQRAQIGDDRQKALAELDRVKQDIDKGKKAIDAIQEEARRAGVPPGWVR